MDTGFLLDKNGREILVGDVVKVFHFASGRRKFYMYKLALKKVMLGTLNPQPALRLSHLSPENIESGYYELLNGRQLEDYEIVQGYGPDTPSGFEPFYYRPKRKPAPSAPEPSRWAISGEKI